MTNFVFKSLPTDTLLYTSALDFCPFWYIYFISLISLLTSLPILTVLLSYWMVSQFTVLTSSLKILYNPLFQSSKGLVRTKYHNSKSILNVLKSLRPHCSIQN